MRVCVAGDDLTFAVGATSPDDHIGADDREARLLTGGDGVHVEVDVFDAVAVKADGVLMRAHRCVETGWSHSGNELPHLPGRDEGVQGLIDRLQRDGRQLGPDPVEDRLGGYVTPGRAHGLDDRPALGGGPKPASVQDVDQIIWSRRSTPLGHD